MGTPAYMSPEQCRGAGEIDHRTDIYALGCVLFQLLCGRPPFIAQTPGDMIACQIRETPPAPSSILAGIGPELDAMVLKCLAKDPAERFQTMSELVRAGAVITGDNHALETIPPMLPRGSGPQITHESIPPTPLPTPRPSTGPIAGMPITTLAGSAASIATNGPSKHRYVWFMLVLLLIGGGITAAVILGNSQAPVAAAAVRDAAPQAVGRDADAIVVDAAAPDAARPDAAPARDAGVRGTIRPKRIDAGEPPPPDPYDHR